MKKLLAILLSLCMMSGVLPMAATAEEIPEEEFLLAEAFSEIEELILEETSSTEEVDLDEFPAELLEDELFFAESEEEIMAFDASSVFTLPNKIVLPERAKDITKENILIKNYGLEQLPSGEKCLSVRYEIEGQQYYLFAWYTTDGFFSHAQISSGNLSDNSGKTLTYNLYSISQLSGLGKDEKYTELQGILDDGKTSLVYVFAYPDGLR